MPNAAPDVFVMVYRRVGVLPSIEAMKRAFAVVYLAMTAAAGLLPGASTNRARTPTRPPHVLQPPLPHRPRHKPARPSTRGRAPS
ncbi:MAG: hypothetical protein DMG04_21985 [Acidobacteria bacterium]|nr:MAG: hypothetical protein DMG04_21985 [Acidobacteriota bacterium]PYQ79825.1 MAG: hypothetical protein DMG03_24740 [Acidobacteriota bacterium]PYQ87636.1 MAG: hypothetical protein DMG02_20305 [Acidobacteriota bacterium]